MACVVEDLDPERHVACVVEDLDSERHVACLCGHLELNLSLTDAKTEQPLPVHLRQLPEEGNHCRNIDGKLDQMDEQV
eukprot:CAMPEP_0176414760 /NCGR_PEP_ID=MMETSP0127-20121128/5435_1 /TAXON_ID=938130 /ORGANISM="Platyophrya macrostoma, Strain WH" /LENGTH=77 /DNA_ID=CAMNT_0017794691 /DNA_START=870 /DNA_END=1099 /DNA_ORIENTATION=-